MKPLVAGFFAGLIFVLYLFAGASQPLYAQDSGAETTVLVKPIAPFVIRTNGKLSGYSIDLWDEIARRTGTKFRYQYVDSITQLLDGIKNGSADIAIAAVSVTAQREQQFDFSHSYFHSGLQIASRGGSSGVLASVRSVIWSVATSPEFYAGILVFFGFVFTIANFFWLIEHKKNDNIANQYFHGVWDAFWWSIVTVTTVGYGDRTPITHGGRVIAIIWIVCGYLGIAWFTAMVTSSVTVSELTGTINGPNSLAGHTVATTRGSTAADWMSRNVPGAKLKVFGSLDEVYQQLLDGNVDAVVFDAPAILYFANHRGKGRTKISGPMFHKEEYGIVFPTGSPAREKVNQALLAIQEDGTQTRLLNKWFGTSGEN